MIAGIYGMNFDYMPELHWRFGYPLDADGDRPSAGACCCTGTSAATTGCSRRRQVASGRAGERPHHAQPAAPAAPPRVGRAAAHVGRRQARADPGRAEPGAGAAVRAAGSCWPRAGRCGRGGRSGGRSRAASWWPGARPTAPCTSGPAPARTWAPRSATRPCTADDLVCRWHGMALGPGGRPGWRTLPAFDDGVLAWVRLDDLADGPVTDGAGARPAPARGPRRRRHRDRPLRAAGRDRQPARPVARRLAAPVLVHRAQVLSAPPMDCPPAEDRFLVEVTFTVGKRFGVPGARRVQLPRPAHDHDGDRRRRGRGLGRGDPRHPAAPRRRRADRARP